MSISDRILLMNKGCLQQYSTPQEMYRFPANLFVAGFLGNPPINLLNCTLENGRIHVNGAPEWNFADISPVAAQPIDKQAVLGIRPEDLTIVSEDGHLQAEVTAIQTLGKEVYLRLQHQDIHLTACLNWDHDYRIGDQLRLVVKKAYLFPADDAPAQGGAAHES